MAKKKRLKKRVSKSSSFGGLLSEEVSVRKVNNRVVVKSRSKKRKIKLTPGLRAQRERFNEASSYAYAQAHHPESRELYAKGIKGKHESPYSVALADFLNPPKVRSIDTSDYHGAIGDIIKVHASDDFMVTKVNVVITDATGTILEQGSASTTTGWPEWNYKTVAVNPGLQGTKIKATAYDRPGNKGTKELVM